MLFAFFGSFCLLGFSTTNAVESDNNKIQDDLISWVRSKGGSFSDKLEIRRVNPEDPTSYMGVFVRETIEAKESLFVIPRDCFIQVFDTVARDWSVLRTVRPHSTDSNRLRWSRVHVA